MSQVDGCEQAEAYIGTLCSQAHHARVLFEQAPADPSAHSALLIQLNQLLAAGKQVQVSLDGTIISLEQGLTSAPM